jgi:hypothetical protein
MIMSGSFAAGSLVSGPGGDRGSGRHILDARAVEQVIETLDQGIDSLLRRRVHDTGEGLKGMGAAAGFRALRHVAGDHRWAQRTLRPMVGRFDPRVYQEAPQVTAVVMAAEFVDQPLIVRITQAAVAPLRRELRLQGLDLSRNVWHHTLMGRVPELQCLLQLILEPLPNIAYAVPTAPAVRRRASWVRAP